LLVAPMTQFYRRAMDRLYLACVLLAGTAMVLISAIIPYGVFTRYVLNSAASWPEATAVLLSIVLTFFGAAACYRLGLHMRVSYLRDQLPPILARICDLLAEALMLGVGAFMTYYGASLCQTTWNQSIAEFPLLSVGFTYLPIPVSGVCLLLFVIEHVLIGRAPDPFGDPFAGQGGH
jgi:TRAP-type C4-dicarboxylate transport system permease small subunit